MLIFLKNIYKNQFLFNPTEYLEFHKCFCIISQVPWGSLVLRAQHKMNLPFVAVQLSGSCETYTCSLPPTRHIICLMDH